MRARFLAQLVDSTHLDEYVQIDRTTPGIMCPDIYYHLHAPYNGGKDPRAKDPADRWIAEGGQQTNRTSDCSGGDSWIDGHDRYQPLRMALAVGYGGYFNTDSKIIDATRIITPKSQARCFEAEERPFVGGVVVCKSKSRGHDIGHEETMIEVPAEWDPNELECWAAIKTSGIRGSGSKANGVSTARGWYKTDALFLRSVMQP